MDFGGTERLLLLGAAFVVEAAVGYPDLVYRKIGHPVTWLGELIAFFDRNLNKSTFSSGVRSLWGFLTITVVVMAAATVGYLISAIAASISVLGLFVMILAISTLLATRSLNNHVLNVANALEQDGLDGGREMVAHIVGRDTQILDEAGVARAAIESLAENFSDGVTAPVFWFAIFGLPGMAVYKAVNTADSMIGHKTQKHHAYGWAAAKLDDLLNLPASRLSAGLLVTAAYLCPGASARNAVTAIQRDAGKHRSPNAGLPEAAMAGALDLQLAGPRTYDGKTVDDATMGSGQREASAEDVRRALQLFRFAVAIGFVLVTLLAVGLFAAI